jgi:CRISPR-associated exonuclease Cas4
MAKTGIRLWVRDVEEYLFCPMVFYFSVVLGNERIKGYWADLGKEIQRDVESKIAQKFDVFAKEFEVESERLGVRGKIDFVVRDGKSLAPLEVKYSYNLKPWWKYSAVLYGILLEDCIKKPVKRCYVFLTESDRFCVVDITDESRTFVEKAVKDCYEILNGKDPKPSKSKSCRNCDFNRMCSEFCQ